MSTLATMVDYRVSLVLAIGQVLKMLWDFEILTWESVGNLTCGISRKKLIVERIRRTFGTRGHTVHIWRVLLMPNFLSLVWGHSAHFANFLILQILKLSPSPNFQPIHPNVIQGIIIIQAGTFLAICQKKKMKKIWHFEISLPQDHLQLKFSKCHFSHNFHWRSSTLYDNIGYHGKSNCLLEYCNEKLASSTWDYIFY